MIHWPLPSPGHGVVKTRETRPETFKAKASCAPRGLRVSQQQWAGIRASHRCRHQRVLGVEVLPFQIVEKLIDADKSGVLSLVYPSESPILALYLSQSSLVNCSSEFSHNPPVNVGVAVVSGFVNDVELAVEDPRLARRRSCRGQLLQELVFVSVVRRPIESGEPEN